MPTPKLPSRYPPEFRTLFERAQQGETIEVPTSSPASLRQRLYGYARALRADNQSELADAVQLTLRAASVVVESRSNSTAGKEVAAALAQLGENTSPDAFFERFAK